MTSKWIVATKDNTEEFDSVILANEKFSYYKLIERIPVSISNKEGTISSKFDPNAGRTFD